MTPTDAIDVAREAIIVSLKLGAPTLLVALGVGLAISVVQALTQIQEMTLSFVPKILVIFVTMLLFLPFMLSTLTGFTHEMMGRIVAG